MEPAFVQPLTEEQLNEVSDTENTVEKDEESNKLHESITNAVHELRLGIYAMKKKMFFEIVTSDTKHSAADTSSLMTFHALFLQCVGYWIGSLDSTPVPVPSLGQYKLSKDFQTLSKAIVKVSKQSSDAHVLVYNLLFEFSTQHPFQMGDEDDENSEEE